MPVHDTCTSSKLDVGLLPHVKDALASITSGCSAGVGSAVVGWKAKVNSALAQS